MNIPPNEIFRSSLNEYLSKSKLSMSQVAVKFNVSKGHLSDLKNGKKKPTLDFGLKVLKDCGIHIKDRKSWAEYYILQDSTEYDELKQTVIAGQEKKKLSETICGRIEHNLALLNIYLDITNSDDAGVSHQFIQNIYGKFGLEQVRFLMEADLVKNHHGRFHASDERLVMTRRSSYGMIKTILEDQREKYEMGQLDGAFQFEIEDLSEKGKSELRELQDATMKTAAQIIKRNKQNRTLGGNRVVFQTLMGVIKNGINLMLLLSLLFSLSDKSQAGIEGGSSSRIQIGHFKNKEEALAKTNEFMSEFNIGSNKKLLKRIKKFCRYDNGRFISAKAEVFNLSERYINKEQYFLPALTIKTECRKKRNN